MNRITSADNAEDAGQIERLKDIWELLKRAEQLGYSVVLTPDQIRELAQLLEVARLAKP